MEFSVLKANACNYANLAAQPFDSKYMRSRWFVLPVQAGLLILMQPAGVVVGVTVFTTCGFVSWLSAAHGSYAVGRI